MTEKLIITIHNGVYFNPISLGNFLTALGREYEIFCRDEFSHLLRKERQLKIRRLRLKGDTVVVELASTTLPINREICTLMWFVRYISKTIDYFREEGEDSSENIPGNLGLENADNFISLLSIIDDGSEKSSVRFRTVKSSGFWRWLFQWGKDER